MSVSACALLNSGNRTLKCCWIEMCNRSVDTFNVLWKWLCWVLLYHWLQWTFVRVRIRTVTVHTRKHTGGVELSILFFWTSFLGQMSVQFHTLVDWLLGKNRGSHWIGSWVGPGAYLKLEIVSCRLIVIECIIRNSIVKVITESYSF